MPGGDLGTARATAGRVAFLAIAETYGRYTIGVVERTSSSMLSCDISTPPSRRNSLLRNRGWVYRRDVPKHPSPSRKRLHETLYDSARFARPAGRRMQRFHR